MFGIEGIEAVEFGSGIRGVEPPVDDGLGGVALGDQGLNLLPESILVGETLPEAATGQDTELDFRQVQPTSVLGGVVELQPLGNPPGLGCCKGLVQGRRPVRVQIVQDQPHHLYLRVSLVHQTAYLMGEVLHGAPLGHRHVAPAGQGFTGQEQVAGALPPVLVVLTPRTPRLGGRVAARN